jgi:hypothetical protein
MRKSRSLATIGKTLARNTHPPVFLARVAGKGVIGDRARKSDKCET